MNGFEPLPGLLDDPALQPFDLPALTDFHIAPLRNPAPSRHNNAPAPLEPLTKSLDEGPRSGRTGLRIEEDNEYTSPPRIKITDVLPSTHQAKKPHLAISELVDRHYNVDPQPLQLPSFVSLSAVEKSPVPLPSYISPNKRPRLDVDPDNAHPEVNRLLPRPAKKDDKKTRPVPLLPAMVTGLHEPPPSAGVLPSMNADARPDLTRSVISRIQVKDILSQSAGPADRRPPEAMLNSPEPSGLELAPALTGAVVSLQISQPEEHSQLKGHTSTKAVGTRKTAGTGTQLDQELEADELTEVEQLKGKQPKASSRSISDSTSKQVRRPRRPWSEHETSDLLAGVLKHGIGRWKDILEDSDYNFDSRTSVDLKDRHRVHRKDHSNMSAAPTSSIEPAAVISDSQEVDKPSSLSNHESEEQQSKPKRKRNNWSQAEDNALLRGVATYGFQWTIIHDDPDLNLSHRRATDLRDRLRNLWPDAYKQADVRPRRAEILKREKELEKIVGSKADKALGKSVSQKSEASELQKSSDVKEAQTPQDDNAARKVRKNGKNIDETQQQQQQPEQIGVTLPSLDLDDGDLDWGDNTLPPLLEWEDIGM